MEMHTILYTTKVSEEDTQLFKTAIMPLITEEIIKKYETGDFIRSGVEKKLQQKFMFDLLSKANLKEVRRYYHKDIEDALNLFMPKITRKY